MTEPNQPQPGFDDSPTTPTQQTPFLPYPPTLSTPVPPSGPQSAPQSGAPTAWQPAGWAGTQDSDPITWTPAGQQPEAPKRGGRGRWIVAILGALVIVVAAAGVAVFALGSKTSAALGPTFLPASTPLYAEVRLDLPGTQRDNVIKLLSHFPGFADPSSFDTKVDDTFNKLIGNATSNQVSYATDVKPWFGGQVAIGLLELPASMGSAMMPGSALTPGAVAVDAATVHAVAGISIKDRSRLDALLATVRALGAGFTFGQEQYGDHTVITIARDGKDSGAYTISDKLLLIAANTADLRTALSVLDGSQPSLASDPGFRAAVKDLPSERLGAMYMSSAVYQAGADALKGLTNMGTGIQGMDLSGLTALKCLQPAVADPASVRFAAAIVANGDSIALQTSSTGLPQMPAGTTTDLAAHVPANSIVYAEVPKVGGSLHDLVACLRTAMPDAFAGDQVKQIEKALGTNLEDYLSFVTDVGISASFDGSKVHWGVVAGVDNKDTATSRVTTLISYAKLAASLGGASISVSEQQVGGVAVTTITLSSMPGMANLPIDPSISIAVVDGFLYIGGGDFASSAITRTAADSLASNERYSSALTAAGTPNGVKLYVDVAAIRQVAEAGLNAARADTNYQTSIQPYLKPFDRLFIGNNQGADAAASRILVFVK